LIKLAKKICMVVKSKVLELPILPEDLFESISPAVANQVFEESNEYYFYDPNRLKNENRITPSELNIVLKRMTYLARTETFPNLQFEISSPYKRRRDLAELETRRLENKLKENDSGSDYYARTGDYDISNRHLIAGIKSIARANRDYLVREYGFNAAYGLNDGEKGR